MASSELSLAWLWCALSILSCTLHSQAPVAGNLCCTLSCLVAATCLCCHPLRSLRSICCICLLLQEFDTNCDGYISQEELSQALASDIADSTQLQDAVREALADADRNKDGRIDYTVRRPGVGTRLGVDAIWGDSAGCSFQQLCFQALQPAQAQHKQSQGCMLIRPCMWCAACRSLCR